MPKDARRLADVLRSELVFLDAGGYSTWGRAGWRLPLIFEESPACPNFNDSSHSTACRDCVLMKLVPMRFQTSAVPCRHIRFNEAGDTLNTLYHWRTMEDLNLIFRRWLLQTIAQLERKQSLQRWIRDQSVYQAAELT